MSRTAIQLTTWPTPNAVLPATETIEGAPLRTRVPGGTAAYHNGWWAPADERIEWSTVVHSVTITDARRTVAARGPAEVEQSILLALAEANW